MKFLSMLLLSMFFALSAFAGFEGYNQGTSLNIFNKINCSTGMSCTRVKDKLTLVSSPVATVGSVTILATEGADGVLLIEADQADDSGDTWKFVSQASDNQLLITNDVSGSDVTKLAVATSGNVTIVGNVLGSASSSQSGFVQKRVAAVASTITASLCGSTFYNSGAVQLELPDASTVLGCRLNFISTDDGNFDVNPANTGKIMGLTSSVGDAIRSAATGNAVTIEAASGNYWFIQSTYGTWSDIN